MGVRKRRTEMTHICFFQNPAPSTFSLCLKGEGRWSWVLKKAYVRHFCSSFSNTHVRVYTKKHARPYPGFDRTLRHMGERREQNGVSKYCSFPSFIQRST